MVPMASARTTRRRPARPGDVVGKVAAGAIGALLLTACSPSGMTVRPNPETSGTPALVVGTTERIGSLDPAGPTDPASALVQAQVLPTLLRQSDAGGDAIPDLAETAEFTAPDEYTVTLPGGLHWANGHELTSSDVAFSIDRLREIDDPNGAAALLERVTDVDTPNAQTIVFTLVDDDDESFPLALTGAAGTVVDEEVFAPDALTPDRDIVDADAFGGAYRITSWDSEGLVEFTPYIDGARTQRDDGDDEEGQDGEDQEDQDEQEEDASPRGVVILTRFDTSENLALALRQGDVDVAFRGLSPADLAAARGGASQSVIEGPVRDVHALALGGDGPPPAVREAIALLVDRDELARAGYSGLDAPLFAFLPDEVEGSLDLFRTGDVDGAGGPDAAQAREALDAAGIPLPVDLEITVDAAYAGDPIRDVLRVLEAQLERDGLFAVELTEPAPATPSPTPTITATPTATPNPTRTASPTPAERSAPPVFARSVVPDSADPLATLLPFLRLDDRAPTQQGDLDLGALQRRLAADAVAIPLLQGAQTAVVRDGVTGVTLDGSARLRFEQIRFAANGG